MCKHMRAGGCAGPNCTGSGKKRRLWRGKALMSAAQWRPVGRLVICAVIAACSPIEQDKVAARVNGEKILAQEVDLALQYKGVAKHDLSARQRLVEKLVIEELLAQQFLRGIPGSAAVEKSAVSAARREILARTYIEELVRGVARPKPDEISAFYRDNPNMFAKRRVFTLRQVDVSTLPSRETELRQRVGSVDSLDELTEWLRRENMHFARVDIERGSDELEMNTLVQLDRLKNGEVGLIDTDNGLRVIQLVKMRPAPLDERMAWPLIEQRLWREMRIAAVEAEVRRLSRMAAISIPEGAPRGAMQALVPEQDDGPTQLPTGVPPASVKAPGG